jgi:acyl-CoA thioester hydrolase
VQSEETLEDKYMEKLRKYEHAAQYYETDMMGVIHHSNYIRWFEEARVDLLGKLGMPYRDMEDQGLIIPVLSASAEYKSMVRYGDTVYITPKLTVLTPVRMTMEYTVTDKATGDVRTIGSTSHAFLNRSLRPIAIKKTHRDIYELLLEAVGKDLF